MKKLLSVILVVIFAVAMFTIPVSAASTGLNKTTVKLAVGEEFYLSLNGASGEVKWSTSDSLIVSVDNGVIRGLKKGSAAVTAQNISKKYTAKITVSEYRIDRKASKVMVGNRLKLRLVGWSGERIWSSSDDSIATVSSDGIVRGIREGTAKITASYGKKRSSFTLTVTKFNIPINASKVAYAQFLPGSVSENAFRNTNSSFITSNKRIKSLIAHIKDLDYAFVEPEDVSAEQAVAFANGKQPAETDRLVFFNKNGSELVRFESFGTNGALDYFVYNEKYYKTEKNNNIINTAFGFLSHSELMNAAIAYHSDENPYADDISSVDILYVNENNFYEEYGFGIRSKNNYTVRAVVSCGQDNGELYTYYLNPFDGSPIEAKDSGDVLKDG